MVARRKINWAMKLEKNMIIVNLVVPDRFLNFRIEIINPQKDRIANNDPQKNPLESRVNGDEK